MKNLHKILAISGTLLMVPLLAGCNAVVLNPAGYVAQQERNFILLAVGTMLLVVVPVMIAVVVLAIKYRAGSRNSEYLPDWGHSSKVETFMWGIPICIIIVLAAITITAVQRFNPASPLPEKVVGKGEPLQIDVVALDWRWLFIYPQYGVASVNEVYASTNQQVFLQMSAEDVINAFWVPNLGTVLYAMPQMNAKLHLYSARDGVFNGASANYSGDGFAGMQFKWHSVPKTEFESWVARARASGNILDAAAYAELTKKSKDENGRYIPGKYGPPEYSPVVHFGQIDKRLYYRVANRCVGDPSEKSCNEQRMKDAAVASLWGELCSVFDPGTLEVIRAPKK
ncbi:MAG: Ubiquinol oxidase subunit II [Candidatus Tokpelaia hoelldobleri]|uniref:Ubiquinol oxidase subunit 2 n=1 Tax=Candidatus Tokpelaia hoelldobleri TaxID=1902579 RepID=A0A1U9JVH5_9HYPH|nr:MAG: Ubiquinol oxidase subunit II [Candidatus Tokpelaia hoelldoblerii]